MSSEVAFLEIRVGGQGVTEARDRLKQLTEQSERAEKAAQKLAAETERAEARKAAAVEAAAAKTDRATTTAYINEGKARERMATDAAKYLARIEALEAKRAAAADRAATNTAIAAGKAQQRMADDAAKYEAAEAKKAAALAAVARKQEQLIQTTGQKQYAEVQKWLLTEEQALKESYLRRRSIIMSQGTGSQKQMDLSSLDYKYQQQLLTLRGSRLDSSKYKGISPGMQTASDAVSTLAAGGGIQALTSTLIRFAPAAAAAAASYALVSKAIGESENYDQAILKLRATTGSVEDAEFAYRALDEMEEKIPLSTEEMAAAFSKLVDTGLNPSERSIRALGEISAGTGASLEKVTDAVANATLGNFKGLREFGIKAVADGDTVKVTFRGVETSIRNDSRSIQEYFTRLGETEFAGSLDKKMNSLSGSVFKLKDAWNDMFRDVGKSDIGPLIKEMVDAATGSLTGFRDLVSGSWASEVFSKLIEESRRFIIELRTADGIVTGVLLGDEKRISQALQWNEERRKALETEKKEAEVEKQRLELEKQHGITLDKNGKFSEKKKSIGDFDEGLTTLDRFNQSMLEQNEEYLKTREKARKYDSEAQEKKDQSEFKQLEKKMRTEEDVIEESHKERQRLIDKYAKGEKWTRMSGASLDEYGDKMEEIRAKREKDIKEIEDSLKGEEEVIRDTYARRIQIIASAVEDEARREKDLSLLTQNEAERRLKFEEDIRKRKEELTHRKEDMFTPYQTEIEQIQSAERRKLEEYQKARDEDLLSEAEYRYLKAELHKKTETDIVESDLKNKEAIAGNSAALFGNLAQLSKNMGGEQSAAYRGMFAASKAFSIAEATISIATGSANALKLPYPANIAAMLAVAAKGAGLMAQITSSNYSGAYDAGGVIPAGRIGLVGERGPEFVQGPATVTGRQQTALMRNQGQAGGQGVSIAIINAPDVRGAAEFGRSTAGKRQFINTVRENATTIRHLVG